MTGLYNRSKKENMKKLTISSLLAMIASLVLSNIALGATALDNMQIQIDKNSATVNINNNNNTKPATTSKKKHDDDDEDEHADNGKHKGQDKGNKKD